MYNIGTYWSYRVRFTNSDTEWVPVSLPLLLFTLISFCLRNHRGLDCQREQQCCTEQNLTMVSELPTLGYGILFRFLP